MNEQSGVAVLLDTRKRELYPISLEALWVCNEPIGRWLAKLAEHILIFPDGSVRRVSSAKFVSDSFFVQVRSYFPMFSQNVNITFEDEDLPFSALKSLFVDGLKENYAYHKGDEDMGMPYLLAPLSKTLSQVELCETPKELYDSIEWPRKEDSLLNP